MEQVLLLTWPLKAEVQPKEFSEWMKIILFTVMRESVTLKLNRRFTGEQRFTV